MITNNAHKCNKGFCATCYENKEVGHVFFACTGERDGLQRACAVCILRFLEDARYETL
jgi:hypothetical protein